MARVADDGEASWKHRLAAFGARAVAALFLPGGIATFAVPYYACTLLRGGQMIAGGVLLGAWCVLCVAVARVVGIHDARLGTGIFILSMLFGIVGSFAGLAG